VNDDEVRALVREAIQRHLGNRRPQEGVASTDVEATGLASTDVEATASLRLPISTEPVLVSFARYKIQRIGDDGMCLIEPAVRCNHCGYCECHGH
jgi:hypothetical protein